MRRQKLRLRGTLVLVTALVTLSYLSPYYLSASYNPTYQLLDHPNGSTQYRLNVGVPQSLYEYYGAKSHTLSFDRDFAKFVTPYSLKPIGDSLNQIYDDDEDFANGVLMIVHQIPYEATGPSKYPVETIVDSKGDCDLFSYIAASIIKAGGFDVVLLYYEQEAHMNLGVSLTHAPRDARGNVFSVTNNNVRYYMAECTGGRWQDGWRVGECPDELKNSSPQVVTLENCEQSAAGQVSASYNTLELSTLTLIPSSTFVIQGSTITLSGQLSPELQNKNITIYIRASNSPWIVLDTTTTDSSGRFSYVWNVATGGMCYVRVSWSGDDDYAVADSPVRTITSISTFFFMLLIIIMILIVVGAISYFLTRQNQQGFSEPEPPEVPS
jgi:hypothetical protein